MKHIWTCVLLCWLLPAAPVFAAVGTAGLGEGDRGYDVAVIQARLVDAGSKEVRVDGVFSRETAWALREYQRRQRLPVTGRADAATFRRIAGRELASPGEKPTLAAELLAFALKSYGAPYKFGATGPGAFDCSGFVQYVFAGRGIQLPRTADNQYLKGTSVAYKDLQPGDLVFFTTYAPGASHCGIYFGENRFIQASSSRGVTITQMDDSYWRPRYLGARRVLPMPATNKRQGAVNNVG